MKGVFFFFLGLTMCVLRAVYSVIFTVPRYLVELGQAWMLALRKNKQSMTNAEKRLYIQHFGLGNFERFPIKKASSEGWSFEVEAI